MEPKPRTFKTRLRVRYAETDQMGVVYHANYLVWFEIGRVEMLRELGFAYKQFEAEQGCALPVVEVSCRYRLPAHYDEQLELETRLIAMRGPVLKFGYELHRCFDPGADPCGAYQFAADARQASNGRGPLLADAMTTHVVVDRQMQTRPLPEPYAAAMRGALG